MNPPPSRLSPFARAFTLIEVMISATLLVLVVAVVLMFSLFCADSVRRQTLAYDATDAVHRLISKMNADCSGVGIVQLFKGMPAGAVPPFAAGAWNGKVTDGNFMILAYPRNILNQNSPIARMCAYYIDPRDNSLMRIDAKFTGATGGVTITDDLMTALNVALNKGADTSFTTERVCYVYPWSMQSATPGSTASWGTDTAGTNGRVIRVPGSSDAAAMLPQSLFWAHGAGTLSVNGAVAVIFGKEAAKASINYTLNVHN